MKRLTLGAFALASLVSGLASAQLQKGDYVAVIGDSITEQKRYSVFIEDYLVMCQPAEDLRQTQFGWSGETSWGFESRMQNDMIRFKPAVATTCFGMNDGGYSPMTDDKAKHYRDAQTKIVEQMKQTRVRFIVVGSPGCVDVNTFRNHNRDQALIYNKTLGSLRLTLVVNNAGSGRVRVTWGKAAKEFDMAALAKGIDLAAEFLDNPFSEPFRRVEQQIQHKQEWETPLVKAVIHEIPGVAKGAQEELNNAATKSIGADRDLSEALTLSVEPVKHTIRIEVVK